MAAPISPASQLLRCFSLLSALSSTSPLRIVSQLMFRSAVYVCFLGLNIVTCRVSFDIGVVRLPVRCHYDVMYSNLFSPILQFLSMISLSLAIIFLQSVQFHSALIRAANNIDQAQSFWQLSLSHAVHYHSRPIEPIIFGWRAIIQIGQKFHFCRTSAKSAGDFKFGGDGMRALLRAWQSEPKGSRNISFGCVCCVMSCQTSGP